MQLEKGKSYLVGQGKHAIDVVDIVEEPGRGSVAQVQYYHIDEPHNRQPELYQVDGFYRLEREPDPNWDVVSEYKKPTRGEFTLKPVDGLFNKAGQPIYPFVSAKALARIYAKGETVPIVKFSYSEDPIEGYVKFDVMPDAVLNEVITGRK